MEHAIMKFLGNAPQKSNHIAIYLSVWETAWPENLLMTSFKNYLKHSKSNASTCLIWMAFRKHTLHQNSVGNGLANDSAGLSGTYSTMWGGQLLKTFTSDLHLQFWSTRKDCIHPYVWAFPEDANRRLSLMTEWSATMTSENNCRKLP